MSVIPAEDGIWSGISDIDYHADRGSLSSSGARALLAPSAPAIFRHQQDEPPKPKAEYDFGHVAHRLILGHGSEIVEVEAENWRGGDAQKARKEAHAAGQVPILTAELAKAKRMADKVHEHPVARMLFGDPEGIPELSGYWHDSETGVRLRYRPDWLCQPRGRVICVDYKTSTSAHPGHFAKAAGEYGYHQQQPWYVDGLAATDVADDAEFLFVVQSKTPPHLVSVIRLDPAAVDLGRRRNREAIDLYARCIADDHWPAYGDAIHTVNIPTYVTYQQEGDLAV